MIDRIEEFWQPKPITPPTVDPDLERMNGPQRAAEVMRHSILSVEYWLSPLGRVREWFRLNSKLSMWLLIPGVLVLPLVTWILYLVAGWVMMIVGIAGHLIVLPVAVVVVVGVLRIIFGK